MICVSWRSPSVIYNNNPFDTNNIVVLFSSIGRSLCTRMKRLAKHIYINWICIIRNTKNMLSMVMMVVVVLAYFLSKGCKNHFILGRARWVLWKDLLPFTVFCGPYHYHIINIEDRLQPSQRGVYHSFIHAACSETCKTQWNIYNLQTMKIETEHLYLLLFQC